MLRLVPVARLRTSIGIDCSSEVPEPFKLSLRGFWDTGHRGHPRPDNGLHERQFLGFHPIERRRDRARLVVFEVPVDEFLREPPEQQVSLFGLLFRRGLLRVTAIRLISRNSPRGSAFAVTSSP